jgi:hypothetical protein
MFIEDLDRHQWSFREARLHVARLILRQIELAGTPPSDGQGAAPQWYRSGDPVQQAQEIARRELLISLKDGDLHAKGRLSKQRHERYASGSSSWDFHSGHHEAILPHHWREGRFGLQEGLEFRDGEFIDIRVPRFAVKAIWPDLPPSPGGIDGAYTTPYLELMQAAIGAFQMSDRAQAKKENLVTWFLEQEIDGEPVSENLANAMATLIRLPSSQRGGSRRIG